MRILSVLGLVASFSGLLVIGGCEFPYSPPANAPDKIGEPDNKDSSIVRLRKVNTDIQICNPSITQDDQDYPGCMLWLNFAGKLNVDPGQFEGEYTTGEDEVGQHDRLTISDTSNTVRWYIMRPDSIQGDLQDPEWAAHPDYIATMGQPVPKSDSYDAYAVSISNKTFFKLNDDKLISSSTPHLWLPNTVTEGGTTVPTTPTYDDDGMVDKQSVQSYFGTDSVKVLFSRDKGGLTVSFVDYSRESPVLTDLPKPAGREGSSWSCESALFSPDGNWVVYNCLNWGTGENEIYVQRVDANALPILIDAEGGDPHWWQSPTGSVYVVYYKPSLAGGLMRATFETDVNDDGSLGATYKRRINLPDASVGDVPAHTLFDADPVKLLDLPFKGGLSPDGRFLCTGYINAYMYILP